MKEVTETRELTDDELNLVTGAEITITHIRTNGEDPFVQTVIFSERMARYGFGRSGC